MDRDVVGYLAALRRLAGSTEKTLYRRAHAAPSLSFSDR